MAVWIIAPGEGAKYMKECVEHNMMVLGWDCVGDIKQYKDKDSLKEALKEHSEEYKDKNPAQAANMLWNFANEVKVGDTILARDGLL